jgi:NitT/TauT family transport system substrate-binding protein
MDWMFMKRKIIILLMLGLGLMLLLGCGSASVDEDSDTAHLPVLRVGTFPNRVGLTPWYIVENGLDIQNGFRVELVPFIGGGVPVNEAMGAGLLDVAHIGSPAAVNSAAVFGAKILTATSEGSGLSLFARPDSDIVMAGNSLDEFPALVGGTEALMGARILFPFGTMAQIGVVRYIDAFGLSLEDVVPVNMQFAMAYQAFRAGEGDILTTFSPGCFTALDDGLVRIGALHHMGFSMYDLLIANSNTYQQNREIIRKYMTLIFEVNDMLTDDKELQTELMQEFYRINGADVPIDMIRAEIEIMYLITSDKARTIDHSISLIQTAEFYINIGILDAGSLDAVKNSVDLTLLREVLGMD